MKPRILWLDVAKGLCMLSVIAGHMGLSEYNGIFYAYHLTAFFILSGYTMKKEFTQTGVTKRFRTLMVPYFVTCAAMIVMRVVNLILLRQETDYKTITEWVARELLRDFMASGTITDFAGVELGTSGAIWFLPAMFFAGVLAQALLCHIPHRGSRYGAGLLLALLAYVSARFVWLPFSVQAGVLAAPLLLLGYDLRHSGKLEAIRLPTALLGLVLFAVGAAAGLTKLYLVTATLPDPVLSTLCSLAACVFVFWLAQKLTWCKPLVWVGKNSVYFLCVHLFEMEMLMGQYFKPLLEHLGLGYTPGWKYVLRLCFITLVTLMILGLRKCCRGRRERQEMESPGRDGALDMAKGLLILLMIAGHFSMGAQLRAGIYSFHMPAFIFFSGYCFKHKSVEEPGRTLVRQARSFLLPYAAFGCLYVVVSHLGMVREVRNVLLGISFTKKILQGVDSIGPVYFILLLFSTKVIYLLLEVALAKASVLHPGAKHPGVKALVVLVLSLTGVWLGQAGYWLPWSLDCALYCLVFYYLGSCFRQWAVMEWFCQRSYTYFVLSSVWMYMIYRGSMELAVRNYGTYGLVILGGVCATVLLYMLCRYLYGVLPGVLRVPLVKVGSHSLYILILHTLFSRHIAALLSLRLTPGRIWFVVGAILLQVLLGIVAGELITRLKACWNGKGRTV